MILRAGIRLTPLRKITAGFFCGSAAMLWSAIIQHYIYKTNPCGSFVTGCTRGVSNLSMWIQTGAYVLIAFSEILVSVTGLECTYTKAPRNMKTLVMSVHLFMIVISIVIQDAFICERLVFVCLRVLIRVNF